MIVLLIRVKLIFRIMMKIGGQKGKSFILNSGKERQIKCWLYSFVVLKLICQKWLEIVRNYYKWLVMVKWLEIFRNG